MRARLSHPSPVLPPLAGAALLAALALWSLPWQEGLGRPRTPIDRSSARALAPGTALLSAAGGVIPEGASLLVRTEPRDDKFEGWYFRIGVALLPGRRVEPAAGVADYVVLVGPRPREAPGELVFDTPTGSVWRRSKT